MCVRVLIFDGFSENYRLRIAFFCRIEKFASHLVGGCDSVKVFQREFKFVTKYVSSVLYLINSVSNRRWTLIFPLGMDWATSVHGYLVCL